MKSGRCALRIGAVTMVWALAACSSAGDMASSRHAVEMFHFELDQAMYDEIWKTTSSEMRAAATKPALIKLLSAVHTKLGKVVATREVNWRENYNTGGTFVTLVMQTKFDHGTGEETFIFKPGGVEAQLVGYNMSSLDMMTS